ncbi:MAG: DUF3717 domain-containing protein [Gammaproteobacteria bacterium]|uniref:DUF3717 domain-containing protein n=1 Tax=Limnobacter sp. TaxID=2003368 RepID=UPI001DD58223|nr:DUF3717 domain-containing protein [Limnobacter sp.]MBU0783280.1 DUF3717 domain-containing protein [Gammaproteobacteria bacterium]MBU0850499.1 DUF3717 domain-containing protein [Gammaproteobacteria bacterium]MBU1267117.1 DUF3717 domain-containing protein [Gammaproteobacteria bacterium]MBU1529502.1 DUF3717 domain-containing protein [Gammaproteobacteria bacterium]MBU1780511.1 DUF3717 domain-containing protein [Gammaproteobacteria bacterium]
MPAKKVQNSKNQTISIVEIERAINYWRQQYPSSRDTMTLCPQAASLAELYARMILFQITETSWAEFSRQAKNSFQEAQQSYETIQHKAA